MYAYQWDEETGGILLTTTHQKLSKEARPVYYQEMDLLGFDRYWKYAKDGTYPYMWAESNNYIYRGKKIATTKGGSCYTKPELLPDDNVKIGEALQFVDIPKMIEKNRNILESLTQDTIKTIYNTYMAYRQKIDVFYVAFSGGKDSVVVLDLVQRTLPHNNFKVLFGDTRMEFPDTYETVERIQKECEKNGIEFYIASSKLEPSKTWGIFGPPSTSNRWCCSVHKTSPQILLLRELTQNYKFTGMAFTGVRAAESLTRSQYEIISEGEKHQGQYSCHAILEWNSAELFLYIYTNNLYLNKAYLKGNTRAGCLVCPNSTGKHEYIKRVSYTKEVDQYLEAIAQTSGKTNYSSDDMKDFIDAGLWRTRKTGRELNFGQDKFEITRNGFTPIIDVFLGNINWIPWAKTIGSLTQINEQEYLISFREKIYKIYIEKGEGKLKFTLLNCESSKNDIKFQSLFRSVIIKSIYCVACGVCEAECKNKCIDMKNGIHINDSCIHCYKCHDIYGHCLRYNSIRNKVTEGKKMEGLDRYYSFGVRQNWMNIFIKYQGSPEFWENDGDGEVPNKKKEAFLNFVKDANIVEYNKLKSGNKFTKCTPTKFGETIFKLGSDSNIAWALILVNLAYTPTYRWLIKNLDMNIGYTPDSLKLMLGDVMGDGIKGKGLGKRNVVDAFKITMCKTPLGIQKIFGDPDYSVKVAASGQETITLNSFRRTNWQDPEPLVILYSLYKFSEACDDYNQFTLSRLLNHEVESNGLSPTQIFGIDRNNMEKILNGLSINYPDFINTSFTLDLDNINLMKDKSSEDVLSLF